MNFIQHALPDVPLDSPQPFPPNMGRRDPPADVPPDGDFIRRRCEPHLQKFFGPFERSRRVILQYLSLDHPIWGFGNSLHMVRSRWLYDRRDSSCCGLGRGFQGLADPEFRFRVYVVSRGWTHVSNCLSSTRSGARTNR